MSRDSKSQKPPKVGDASLALLIDFGEVEIGSPLAVFGDSERLCSSSRAEDDGGVMLGGGFEGDPEASARYSG